MLASLGVAAFPVAAVAQARPVGPGATIFSPTQNISNDAGSSLVQQMAIDSKGNINVVWWDKSPGYNAVFFSRSIDGGLTFSIPQNISNDPSGATPPNMAIDSTGNIYVTWAGWSVDSGFLTRSADGVNFSAPVKVADNIGWTPSITFGVDRSVYLGLGDASRYHSVYFTRSADGGTTFSPPVFISSMTYPFGGVPLIGVDSAGNIDLVWEGCFANCPIWFSGSKDGGQTFSPQLEIGQAFDFPSPLAMAIGSDGDINVVYNTVPFGSVYLLRSADGGASFIQTNVSTNTNPHFTTATDAQIVIDSHRNIGVVWDDRVGDIYFSRSTDQGTTFSSATISNGAVRNFAPRVALDQSDNINVVWTGSLSSSYDVFFSHSSDNGATFSTPQQLSNNAGSSSPTPELVLDSLGNPSVTWVDYSSGNPDIFSTRGVLQIPPVLPKSILQLP
ncbi:MAG: hypothetical protein ACJ71Q_19120 [Terriglobales bacterium]